MVINTPEVTKTVEDYDIYFDSGIMIPITIDKTAGDRINILSDKILAYLAAKPSKNDPTKTLPAEDITVFLSKVVSIQHRAREITVQSQEDQSKWAKEFKELTSSDKTVQ